MNYDLGLFMGFTCTPDEGGDGETSTCTCGAAGPSGGAGKFICDGTEQYPAFGGILRGFVSCTQEPRLRGACMDCQATDADWVR